MTLVEQYEDLRNQQTWTVPLIDQWVVDHHLCKIGDPEAPEAHRKLVDFLVNMLGRLAYSDQLNWQGRVVCEACASLLAGWGQETVDREGDQPDYGIHIAESVEYGMAMLERLAAETGAYSDDR